jgi:recombination protein RecT
MIELVMRTGKLASLKTGVVCDGELFITETTHEGEIFRHMPDLELDIRDESNIRYVYAIARLKGSEIPLIEIMTKAQVNANEAKNRKGQKRSGPWNDYWPEMARKTVLRKIYKMLPKNPEMVELMEREDEGNTNMADVAKRAGLDRTMGGSSPQTTRTGAASVMADIMEAEATVTTAETNPV